ncbi:hypothetical protein SBOR_3500 [Sclerotinia borealis F-4128]|uniref:Uncharacterized protein n=1 Tax=Sclerotinia borealis (strain F-4128) TaxID=1432307 RepID=W9CJR3_SCLBF|nr:hypothetical protein SBOR_3500 [Sclerotinia borealis F-4128]
MSFIGAFRQAFGSDSSTLAPTSRDSTHANKSSDMYADQGDLGSRDSIYTTKSSSTFSDEDSFQDISHDIELGKLPTHKPQAANAPTNNEAPLCSKLKREINNMRRTGFLDFMKVPLLAGMLCLVIVIPIDLIPMFTDISYRVAFAFKNTDVINGTVNYGNGTIAPLNDVNLAGSNLTVYT